MWTYVVAFTKDLKEFMMVRSRKRGGWEMPGGRGKDDESPIEASFREFMEETGHELISDEKWVTNLGDGHVHFGFIGQGDPSKRKVDEIIDVSTFNELPGYLAYPSVEYEPMIELGRVILTKKV